MNLASLDNIKGEPLTGEQKSYLEGLFAGLKNRGFSFQDVLPDPVGKPAPSESMIFEERVKAELHPLDAYHLIAANSVNNQPPDKENAFRFKWHGLFWLAPNHEGFMARLRIPGGLVKTYQLRELAQIAKELTTGYVQITTRANFQIRVIAPQNAPEVLRRIQGVGLHTRGAGADNIRNITLNPTAGVDPYEWADMTPYCLELAQFIVNHREFYNLPRKFNIALDGGGLIGSVEDTNDIGVRAVQVPEESEGVPPGVYFRMRLGGATGHKAFARDLGVLIRAEQLIQAIIAAVRVFIDNGNRGHRKQARLKHLLDRWTLEQYLKEMEKRLDSKLMRDPLDDQGRSTRSRESALPKTPHSHIGVHPQKQPGLYYIGAALPIGQIAPKQMLRLAELADHYGSGEVRLTVWQNLILPNIPEAYVETVKKALVKCGLDWKTSPIRSGIIACTGNSYCKYASSNTKGHAAELGRYLEKRVKLEDPINIHLTGCPHSCAQHYMGDVGLLGAKVKVSGETVEGYHVFVGGGFGENRAVGRQVFQGISFESLKPTLEKMLNGYLRHRRDNETFQAFTSRQDLNSLQRIFSE